MFPMIFPVYCSISIPPEKVRGFIQGYRNAAVYRKTLKSVGTLARNGLRTGFHGFDIYKYPLEYHLKEKHFLV